MKRWDQFCLCWCLGWLHQVHGVCTHLNWAHDLTIRTLKPPFLGCFGTCTDSVAAYTQSDKIARAPLPCFMGEKVQILSCAQQCCAVSPLHLSNITPHVTQISQGAKALFPSSLQKWSSLWTLCWLCALWWGGLASQVLQVKLVMTQRCEWAQGLGCGCCSCLHLMPCVIVVVAAECRHQRGELTR